MTAIDCHLPGKCDTLCPVKYLPKTQLKKHSRNLERNLFLMKERCIIITSHIQGSIKDIIDPKDAYIICADGRYDLATREGITPDITINNFYSDRKSVV